MKKILSFATLLFSLLSFQQANSQIQLQVDTVYRGEALDIIVTAQNVDFTQGSNLVHFFGGSTVYIPFVKVLSPTSISIPVNFSSSNSLGYYDLNISNGNAGIELTELNAIYLMAAKENITLDSISLHKAIQGGKVAITVYGQNIGKKIGATSNEFYMHGPTRLFPSKITNIDDYRAVVEFDLNYQTPLGEYDFIATNSAANYTYLYKTFEVLKGSNTPRVVSPYLDTVSLGETIQIEVTGINTNFNQGTNLVHFKQGNVQVPVSGYKANSPTSLTLTAVFRNDLPSGYYSLSIINYSGADILKDSAIVVVNNTVKATIDSLSINTASENELIKTSLFLSNSNISTSSNNIVYLVNNSSSVYATGVKVLQNGEIEASFKFTKYNQSGWYSAVVENGVDGKIRLDSAFYLKNAALNPRIISLDEDTIQQGEYLDVILTTADIDFTQGSNLVHFVHSISGEKYSITDFTVLDTNRLKFRAFFASSSSQGYYDLAFSYYGETEYLYYNDALFVTQIDKAPVIDSMSLKYITQGENITVSVYGTNTHFLKNNFKYHIQIKQGNNQIYPESITSLNDTVMNLNFKINYGYDTGHYDLFVYNDFDGYLKLDSAIVVLEGLNAPRIISITIDTVRWFETVNIDIQSENMDFTKGTNTVSLSKDGNVKEVNDVLVNSVNSLTFTQKFDDSYEEGYYDISVTNSDSKKTMVKARALYVKSDLIDANNKAIIASEISFYPNPSNGQLHLNQTVDLLEVFDLNGKKLLEFKNIDFVNIEGVDLGTYLLKITNVGDSKIEKLVIK